MSRESVSVAQVSTCAGLGLAGEGEDGAAQQMHTGGGVAGLEEGKPKAHRLKPVPLPSVPIDLSPPPYGHVVG